jgi:hypothetical protein
MGLFSYSESIVMDPTWDRLVRIVVVVDAVECVAEVVG